MTLMSLLTVPISKYSHEGGYGHNLWIWGDTHIQSIATGV